MSLRIDANWSEWLGYEIVKKSNKPFKSGQKMGIAKDITLNPNTDKLGFKMDDGSIVDCHMCQLLNKK